MGEREKHDWRIGDRDGDVRGSPSVDIYDESIFHRMVLVMNPSNVRSNNNGQEDTNETRVQEDTTPRKVKIQT